MAINPHNPQNYDYSEAGDQQEFELIPDGTICAGVLSIRGKGAGPDGMQKLSADGRCMGLDCVTTIMSGPYEGRKVFRFLITDGETEGHKEAAKIAGTSILAMMNSAYGWDPRDKSPETQARRRAVTINGWAEKFDGIAYWFKVGIDPAKNGYKAKNIISLIITPDMPGWQQLPQRPSVAPLPAAPAFAAVQQGAAPPPPSGKPAWAR